MIAKLKMCLVALPIVFVALAASVDCSNSSTYGCPESSSSIDVNAACSPEGFICPYGGDSFDRNRTGSVADCLQGFVEYTCTQKKWTLTAQTASAPCIIDGTDESVIPGSGCSLGVGRCAVAAGTLACQSTCDGGATAYGASCLAGHFVVATISCSGFGLDGGNQDDASADDAASSDAGDD